MQGDKYVKLSYGNLDVAVEQANNMYAKDYLVHTILAVSPDAPVIVVYERIAVDESDPVEVVRKALAKLTPKERSLLFQ